MGVNACGDSPTYQVEPLARESKRGALQTLFLSTLFAFVVVTLFDPMDLLLGLKVPLYALCWTTGVLYSLFLPGGVRVRIGLLLYALIVVWIPLASIGLYYVIDGTLPFEGFPMFKAYAFITLAILLYITRTQLLPSLCVALSVLSIAIVILGSVVLLEPSLLLPIYMFGDRYGMFSISNRDYGSGLVMFQMYFVTSSMLAVSASYYLHRAILSQHRRLGYGLLTVINLAGMILAGSRNNLLAAIVLPVAIFFIHARRKVVAGFLIGMSGMVGLALIASQLRILLDPSEPSNRTKLQLLTDYGAILSDPQTLLFGRGLGAYEHWSGGRYYYVTELTYLELFRNFGVILGAGLLLLLLYPILYAFVLKPSYPERSVVIGYLVYLGMAASNPLLFSSMGMMILSVIMANVAIHQRTDAFQRRVST